MTYRIIANGKVAKNAITTKPMEFETREAAEAFATSWAIDYNTTIRNFTNTRRILNWKVVEIDLLPEGRDDWGMNRDC